MMNKVYIIEDNAEVRLGLELLLENASDFQILGSFDNAEKALKTVFIDKPDIILMDIDLPGKSGIEATLEIKSQLKEVNIIIITVFENSKRVFEALCAGAVGYLTKNTPPLEILTAIQDVQSGGAPMSTHIARLVVDSFNRSDNNSTKLLSEREIHVLNALAAGKTYSTIATESDVSKETVRTHIKNIYRKLEVHTKEDAIRRGREERLI